MKKSFFSCHPELVSGSTFKRTRCRNKFGMTQSGFTLIELLIVVMILSVLTVMVASVVNPAEQIAKGKDGQRKSDLSQIQKAIEAYYQDKGKYPESGSALALCKTNYEISVSDNGLGGNCVDWGQSWRPYMNQVPGDPGGKKYVYYNPDLTNGQTYYIYASLDRGAKDPQICKNLNANGECLSVPVNNLCNASGTTYKCNFGISSPNVTP